MVLAERNSELVRNGRRSRGPSPNNGHAINSSSGPGAGGTGTPETSSDDDNSIKRNGKAKAKQSEYEEKIRVGRDYQAVCPPLIPETDRKPETLNDRALLVWSPTKEIPDTKLEEYISVAKEKYGYNGEQALGMLFWHKHDLERAVMDLSNFTPFPDEWTVEDKVLFEQAFQFHGKSFHRIRQMLPDKSIASLVKYYYSWKKTRHRQSVMDRQEKIKLSKEGSENGSENGSNEDSDTDDKVQTNKQVISALKRKIAENTTEEVVRPIEPGRINGRWTNEEMQLALQGVRKFGKDFQAIAEVLGTKTETHVRTFYISNRRRYNLDQIVKTYEAEKEAAAAAADSTLDAESSSAVVEESALAEPKIEKTVAESEATPICETSASIESKAVIEASTNADIIDEKESSLPVEEPVETEASVGAKESVVNEIKDSTNTAAANAEPTAEISETLTDNTSPIIAAKSVAVNSTTVEVQAKATSSASGNNSNTANTNITKGAKNISPNKKDETKKKGNNQRQSNAHSSGLDSPTNVNVMTGSVLTKSAVATTSNTSNTNKTNATSTANTAAAESGETSLQSVKTDSKTTDKDEIKLLTVAPPFTNKLDFTISETIILNIEESQEDADEPVAKKIALGNQQDLPQEPGV